MLIYLVVYNTYFFLLQHYPLKLSRLLFLVYLSNLNPFTLKPQLFYPQITSNLKFPQTSNPLKPQITSNRLKPQILASYRVFPKTSKTTFPESFSPFPRKSSKIRKARKGRCGAEGRTFWLRGRMEDMAPSLYTTQRCTVCG